MKCKYPANLLLLFCFAFNPAISFSQSLDLGVRNTGLSIGNSQNWTGIRFNYRDYDVDQITGINVSIWRPEDPATGNVRGIAIGIPVTGAYDLTGISLSPVGTGAENNLTGLHLAGLGLGAGSTVRGLQLAGLGVGAGNDLSGITIAGLGIGSGNSLRGITIAGLGAGAGNNISGLTFGGLGIGAGDHISGVTISFLAVGAGNNLTGFNLAGIAVGGGNNIQGISIAGLVLGAGNHVTGINLSPGIIGAGNSIKGINMGGIVLGAGNDITGLNLSPGIVGAGNSVRGVNVGGILLASGNHVHGLNLSALAVVSPRITGFTAALNVAGKQTRGFVVAPAFNRIEKDGHFSGVSISAYNRITGSQEGLTIGILNYTRHLRGAQIGLLNIASQNPKGRKALPVFNWNFKK